MSGIKKDYRAGFTIVELLIVIVVIGVLASLVVVAYNGIQNRSYDVAVQSDLRQFASKIKQQETEAGTIPTSLSATLGIKFTRNAYNQQRNNLYYCVNVATQTFIIYGQSKSNNGFVYRSDEGLKSSPDMGGYSTCESIGLGTSFWPQANAINYSAPTTTWASWVN